MEDPEDTRVHITRPDPRGKLWIPHLILKTSLIVDPLCIPQMGWSKHNLAGGLSHWKDRPPKGGPAVREGMSRRKSTPLIQKLGSAVLHRYLRCFCAIKPWFRHGAWAKKTQIWSSLNFRLKSFEMRTCIWMLQIAPNPIKSQFQMNTLHFPVNTYLSPTIHRVILTASVAWNSFKCSFLVLLDVFDRQFLLLYSESPCLT